MVSKYGRGRFTKLLIEGGGVMSGAMSEEYRANRARFSPEELLPYKDKWVAFSADGSLIVASADDGEACYELVKASGEDPDKVCFERIVFEDEGCTDIGGADI